MRQRDPDRGPERDGRPHPVAEPFQAEQPAGCDGAHRDHERGIEQPQLGAQPWVAEVELAGGWGSVPATPAAPAGEASGRRAAVEGLVQLVSGQSEPATEGLTRAAAPGQALRYLHGPRGLADEQRALAGTTGEDRRADDREARLVAGGARAARALERRNRRECAAHGVGPNIFGRDTPMQLPLESVPNFSAARDVATVSALRGALSGPARLLDVHADEDHNRSVFTLVGTGEELVETLLAGVRVAVERVDLRTHEGVHPRIGAADVVPLVPIRPGDEPRAKDAALALADRIASELELPVFLYGALSPDRRGPAFFRRGGPAELQRRIDAGEVVPDLGPRRLHVTAGGALVGVRRPLVAFNVNLRSRDLHVAKEIARRIRERDGGLPGVRALGLDLPRQGLVQVSMNLEEWEQAAPHEVVARICAEAAALGVEVDGSELIGLMPAGAAAVAAGRALLLGGFEQSRVLELRLLD